MRAHLIDQLLGFAAFEPGDVVLDLSRTPSVLGDGAGIERYGIELGERGRPVEGLGHARCFEQILPAQRLHEVHDLFESALPMPGTLVRTIFSSRSADGYPTQ